MLLLYASPGRHRFHLVTENCKLNQSNNQTASGNRARNTEQEKSSEVGSENPSALPGIRTTLSGLLLFICKNKGIRISLPNSKIQWVYIQDDVYIFVNRKTKLKEKNESKIKNFFYLKKCEQCIINMIFFFSKDPSWSLYIPLPSPLLLKSKKENLLRVKCSI